MTESRGNAPRVERPAILDAIEADADVEVGGAFAGRSPITSPARATARDARLDEVHAGGDRRSVRRTATARWTPDPCNRRLPASRGRRGVESPVASAVCCASDSGPFGGDLDRMDGGAQSVDCSCPDVAGRDDSRASRHLVDVRADWLSGAGARPRAAAPRAASSLPRAAPRCPMRGPTAPIRRCCSAANTRTMPSRAPPRSLGSHSQRAKRVRGGRHGSVVSQRTLSELASEASRDGRRRHRRFDGHGSFDDVHGVASLCDAHGVWLHVDARVGTEGRHSGRSITACAASTAHARWRGTHIR